MGPRGLDPRGPKPFERFKIDYDSSSHDHLRGRTLCALREAKPIHSRCESRTHIEPAKVLARSDTAQFIVENAPTANIVKLDSRHLRARKRERNRQLIDHRIRPSTRKREPIRERHIDPALGTKDFAPRIPIHEPIHIARARRHGAIFVAQPIRPKALCNSEILPRAL